MQERQLFRLTVMQDRQDIEESDRQAMITDVEHSFNISDSGRATYAWTGDAHGAEFLFKEPVFDNLFRKISEKSLAT